jgi:ankyrin repeat protein
MGILDDASFLWYKESFVILIGLLSAHILVIPFQMHRYETDFEEAFISAFRLAPTFALPLIVVNPICYLLLRLLLLLKPQQLTLADSTLYFIYFPVALSLWIYVGTYMEKICNAIAKKLPKLKHKELVDICCNLRVGATSFRDVEQWLFENQEKHGLLEQAANQEDKNTIHPHLRNNRPIHHLVCVQPPLDLVRRILQLSPCAIKKKNKNGSLPLHLALSFSACDDVLQMLFSLYPRAVKEQNIFGYFPLHYACCSNASTSILKILIEVHPEALEVKNEHGHLPLHLLCRSNKGTKENLLQSLNFLLDTYPDGVDIRDNFGNIPSDYIKPRNDQEHLLHNTIVLGLSIPLFKLLLRASPESCVRQDNSGMAPLHHACVSNSPHFFDYIVALLDGDGTDSVKFQDCHGRTAAEILSTVASITDEKGMLTLHRLAARSGILTVKALSLFLAAHPEGVFLPDLNNLLPFHHASLNEAVPVEVLMFFIQSFPEVLKLS